MALNRIGSPVNNNSDSRNMAFSARRQRSFNLLAFWTVIAIAGSATVYLSLHFHDTFPGLFRSSPIVALKPESATIDLGVVREGTYPASFHLTNTTRAPVRIIRVSKSCGCTDVFAPTVWVAPGESVTIQCKWDLRGKTAGTQSSLTVRAEQEEPGGTESQLEPVRLLLNARVVPAWNTDPAFLSFSEGQSETKSFMIKPLWESGVRLDSADCPHDAFAVNCDTTTGRVTLSFRSDRWLLSGPVDVFVKTTSSICPVRRIRIEVHPAKVGLVQRRVEAVPTLASRL
jgi:hypothetical protein